MGGSGSKFEPFADRSKDGTILCEMKVRHLRDAHSVVGLVPDNFVPVSIVPKRWTSRFCGGCCCCCWTSVPSGFSAIVSTWGKDVGGGGENDDSWEPGFHWVCPWHRVNRLVSRQLVIFDTPVKAAKTKDNIPMHLDVLIVFEIVQAADFIYNIGPEKFDELLRASQEEMLRQIASETPVERIHDLYGDVSEGGDDGNTTAGVFQGFIEKMNEKFEPYGVKVHHFTVTNAVIPKDMAEDFEEKTLYESKTLEKQMEQVRDRMTLDQDEAKMKLHEECQNARMAVEEVNVTGLAQLVKGVREYEASTQKELDLKTAERDAQVTDITVNAEYDVAKIGAEILAMKRENAAKLLLEDGKIEAEAEGYEKSKRAVGKMEASQKLAEGKRSYAKAEGGASSALQARRAQEQQMLRLDVIEKMADNNNVNVATSLENNLGLAPGNSLVTQITQQGMQAVRTRLAEWTTGSAGRLNWKADTHGGIIHPAPQQIMV